MKHAGTGSRNHQIQFSDYTKDLATFQYYKQVQLSSEWLKSSDNIDLDMQINSKKAVQNMPKRTKNGTELVESHKVLLSSTPLKRYILNDSINTLPHGHKLLRDHIYIHNKAKYENSDYQKDAIVNQKLKSEQNIYINHRRSYLQHQLYKTGLIENNEYEVKFIETLLENKI